jgi:hypothetical protein
MVLVELLVLFVLVYCCISSCIRLVVIVLLDIVWLYLLVCWTVVVFSCCVV